MEFQFTQVLNAVTGKITYFFSNDGRFPVNEEACSAQTLQAELASRQINHVALGLFALGNGQYGVYAETKTAMNQSLIGEIL